MATHPLRLISWNVAGRARPRLEHQITALCDRCPDIVALQEVTSSTAAHFRAGLARIGLAHVEQSLHLGVPADRRRGVLVASRWPLTPSADTWDVPEPHKMLSVTIPASPWGTIELHTAHVPYGEGGKERAESKNATLGGIAHRLGHHVAHHRILCGDFNTPQAELPAGQIVTWGQQVKDNGNIEVYVEYRGVTGAARDVAERAVLEGLARFGLMDVYRRLPRAGTQDFSYYDRTHGRRVGRRYDHVLASPALNPTRCQYLHDLREGGWSDHAPVEVWFAPEKLCGTREYRDERL